MKNPEITTARNWHLWLWLSPLLTIPTLVSILYISLTWIAKNICPDFNHCNYDLYDLLLRVYISTAVLGSGLWHLVLLIPARNQDREFVRWHGRQMLLLATLRTAIPITMFNVSYLISYEEFFIFSIPILILIWFAGTLWGERQAGRGDCALMRWTGRGAGLPLLVKADKPAPTLYALVMREKSDHRAKYYQGSSLREQGKKVEAAQIFYNLILSDATQEFKARIIDELLRFIEIDENLPPDILEAIFRFTSNAEQRQKSLVELKHLGMTETM